MWDMSNDANKAWVDRINIQEVIDNIDEIIALVDANKIVRMINKTARNQLEELADLKPGDLLGHRVDEVLSPFIADGISVVAKAVDEKRPLQKNIRYILESKFVDTTILYSAIPIFEDGELRYLVATGRDMTKLMQFEERLAAAEKLNQYFFTMVHDQEKVNISKPIVYSSKAMEDVLKLASRASQSDATVFITGESGVGKEEIAKFIHRNSDRHDKPYIAINCSAIPRELIESELFGYVEGAFTGSKKGGKKGIIEDVDGGTLFLDEIGDLPPELQGKFLRVLQDGSIRRIGSNRDIKVDVRYISATNIPREKLLDNSLFRQDLLYRLSVLPIFIPPVRERREDIVPLVEYFLYLFNLKYNRRVQLTAAAYAHLCTLPWRGNVRQIKNVVERIVILSEDGALLNDGLLSILQLDLDVVALDGREPAPESAVSVHKLTTLSQAREQLEKQLIGMALDEYETVPKAAKALGVPPSTLYRKLNRQPPE